MSHTDPVADMLTRIRNALTVRRDWVVAPHSRTKEAIIKILIEQGFLRDYHVTKDTTHKMLRIQLMYHEDKQPAISGLRRVSKPGLRIYVGKKDVPRFYGGRGLSIVSTSQGMMIGREAWRKEIGGELLCYVW